MRESLTEVCVGAVVLGTAGIFLAYTLQTTNAFGASGEMTLSASFRSIDGVSVGSDVRLAGVDIGTVSAMSLNSQTFRADAVLSIDSAVPIPNDSSAVIASEGLLGGSYVDIVPGGSFDVFASGDEITDTQGAVSLLQLLMAYVGGEGDA